MISQPMLQRGFMTSSANDEWNSYELIMAVHLIYKTIWRFTKAMAMNKDALKRLRKSLGLTQAEMAESLGLKREQYNRVENGKANLSAASNKLAQQLAESSIPVSTH